MDPGSSAPLPCEVTEAAGAAARLGPLGQRPGAAAARQTLSTQTEDRLVTSRTRPLRGDNTLTRLIHHAVAYLKELGARSRDRLPGSGYDLDCVWLDDRTFSAEFEVEDLAIYRTKVMIHTVEYNTLQLASLKYGHGVPLGF